MNAEIRRKPIGRKTFTELFDQVRKVQLMIKELVDVNDPKGLSISKGLAEDLTATFKKADSAGVVLIELSSYAPDKLIGGDESSAHLVNARTCLDGLNHITNILSGIVQEADNFGAVDKILNRYGQEEHQPPKLSSYRELISAMIGVDISGERMSLVYDLRGRVEKGDAKSAEAAELLERFDEAHRNALPKYDGEPEVLTPFSYQGKFGTAIITHGDGAIIDPDPVHPQRPSKEAREALLNVMVEVADFLGREEPKADYDPDRMQYLPVAAVA